ncbi:hypothetical protein NIES4073_34740 [Kalymmatonema gypsitolerans NIES-4073]|nr:hypothetical protein NIES4073_34740 [Scytonema sp. NIES-4073]
MKILIDNGAYSLRNIGDIAMLQVTIKRLQNLWNNAHITVFTSSPELLIQLCPSTNPLLTYGREVFFSPLINNVYKVLPSRQLACRWSEIEWYLRKSSPSLTYSFLKFKLRKKVEDIKQLDEFIKAVYDADLVVTSGGGYITDEFKEHALSVINTLSLANIFGKPTAMFGLGIGPIQDKNLLSKTKVILPSVNFIATRERLSGLPLLNSIGVSSERIITTGDDAIELAYRNRNPELGNGIGVNLRVAQYSDVNLTLVERVRSALQDAAKTYDAPLLPIPIDHTLYEGYAEPDSVTIQKLIKGYDDTSDGGKALDTPLKVIEQVGRCRVVVTGSYHAGVFALSQGTPVIGLAKSQYYKDKFFGLADQFGCGCEILLLDDKELEEKLIAAIHHSWQSAEQLRSQLLEAAWRQIDVGHSAYKRVFELVQS